MVGHSEPTHRRRFAERHEEAVSVPIAAANPALCFGYTAHARSESLFGSSSGKGNRAERSSEEARLRCIRLEPHIPIPERFQGIGGGECDVLIPSSFSERACRPS